ncbi:MAG TPA: hypothetical protein VGA98_00340 [Allosphingosinicella sp.]|jgi:hypothetical protein
MEKKTFAFKLADKTEKSASKWNARDGIALAGCTEYRFPGNYRYAGSGADNGVYC